MQQFAVIEVVEPGSVTADMWCNGCQTNGSFGAQIWAFTMQCLVNIGSFTECRTCRRDADFQCSRCLAKMPFSAVLVSAHIRTHYVTVA